MALDKAAVRGSYPLGISATKTTHIIFPSKIREFDAGTDYVLAQVPENVTNVLRVKANGQTAFCAPGSTAETNMTIITDDGNLYSFLVRHQPDPEVLNINMANNQPADEPNPQMHSLSRANHVPVLLTNGKANAQNAKPADLSPTELRHDSERIYERKGFIRRIKAKKQGISSRLMGLYVHGKVMYLQLAFQNKTDIDYDVDFIKFYVRDRDKLKRMAAQEVELQPYTTYPAEVRTLKANTKQQAIFALPLRTLSDDKVLEIELYERDGGRHLKYQADSNELIKAKSL
jgi:conjugative transposon TraN protein